MANKIKYGLRNVFYAKVVSTDASTGAITYATTPVAIPGAVNLAMDASGDQTPFFADDVVYWMGDSNNGYSGTLEIALVPDSFRTDVLGEKIDSSGVYYETADSALSEFALLFEFQGDESATRHCMFRCSASRPSVNGATKEASITPQTETLNITAMARINDQLVKARCPKTATTAYNAWFSGVPTITVATSG